MTKNTYKNTVLKESQIAAMNEFVDIYKIIINALGYKVLETYYNRSSILKIDDEILYINTFNVKAKGRVTSEGFIVFKDYKISVVIAKPCSKGTKKKRESFEKAGIVKDNMGMEDILFSSFSAASDFVLEYSFSGLKSWANKEGKTLKEIVNKALN